MPLHASNRRVCRHCDGFCVVAITTGGRHLDGSRVLFRVVCRACQDTGHAAPARIAQAGK